MNLKDPMWMPKDESLLDVPTPYSDAHRLVDFDTRKPILIENLPVVGLHVAKALERRLIWRSGYYCKLFKELRAEKNEWKAKYQAERRAAMVEGMDPNGTIWEHAADLKRELDTLKAEMEILRREAQTKVTEMAHHVCQLESDLIDRLPKVTEMMYPAHRREHERLDGLRRKVAELCGVEKIDEQWMGWSYEGVEMPGDLPIYFKVPDYPRDMEAIAKAVQDVLLADHRRATRYYIVKDRITGGKWDEATAAQCCEAFIEAMK